MADPEAWVAVDENSCLLVQVPKITGRYYTVQFLNGWGETVPTSTNASLPITPMGSSRFA